MGLKSCKVFSTVLCVLSGSSAAVAATCNEGASICWGTDLKSGGSSSSAQPTTGSKITVNPSAVPVDDGIGAEAIFFDGTPDLVLVKGNGRVGAGVSLSNGEETFFGPPGFELASDYLKRSIERKKYESQKLNIAAALAAYSNRKSGIGRFEVNLGVAGKINKSTKAVRPGAGVSMVAGFLMFGYAASEDEYLIDYSSLGMQRTQKYPYSIETLSLGIYLNSLIIDYANVRVYAPGMGDFTYNILTGTLLWRHWMFSTAIRDENSIRPVYDPATQSLAAQQKKQNIFAGVQYSFNKNFMASVFYDYYLLKEVSAAATVFF